MSEWPRVALGSQTTKIGSGATPRGGESVYQSHGVSLIRSQNVLDNSMRVGDIARISDAAAEALRGVTVEANDVLINITGDSVARCATVNAAVLPARVNQHVAILRPRPSLDSRFLQKLLVAPDMKSHLLAIATAGGTRNALTKAQLSDLHIPLPPLSEQQAIAEVLGALDDKIAANNALAATARELGVAMLRIEGPTTPLGNVVLHHKRQINPSSMDERVVEHYSLPAFDDGSGPEVVTPNSIKSNKFAVETSAVLVSKLNPQTPRVWPVNAGDAPPRLASTEFLVLEPVVANPWVMWALLSQPSFTTALQGLVAGTSGSHQRVRPEEVLATPILDPRSVLPQLLADAGEILAPIDVVLRENRTLAATRDALLPQLMSGKLRVRDAEEMIVQAGV